MSSTKSYLTIHEALLRLDRCEREGARFVKRSGEAVFYPYKDILARAQARAAAFQALGLKVGDRVAVILPTSIDFLDVFLGAMLAGGIPAPLYPPTQLGKLDEYFARSQRMLEKIEARFLVTDRLVSMVIGPLAQSVASFCTSIQADKLHGPHNWSRVDVHPDSPAFLQFSSGTTLEPKAVIVTHKNLLSNLAMIDSFFEMFTQEEVERGGVCWLPLYHDMGLIGFMFMGLYHPGTVTYLGPDVFIAKPRIWLETMSRYKAIVSAAPDFAYALCTSKIKNEELTGIDLSQWRIAFNGAEPIDPNNIRKFTERFAAWGFKPEVMTPGYGLAEAGLAVSFSPPLEPPRVTEFDSQALSKSRSAVPGTGRSMVSVGTPVPGLVVEIHDEHGHRVRDGTIGTIMVQGPSVTPGYYNDPELSKKIIRNGWLDTGDLGFVHDGSLHVSGRLKDLIIIRGRNIAPQQIEHLVAGVDGLRIASTAAVGCSFDGEGEQLVVLAERDAASNRPAADIDAEIRQRIAAGIALIPRDVRIVEPGTLPRTASGKLRRSEILRLYQTNGLAEPQKVNALLMAKEVAKSQLAWGKVWLNKIVDRPSSIGDRASSDKKGEDV